MVGPNNRREVWAVHSMGAFDAWTRPGRRLCLVENQGKRITITRHG